MIDSFEIRNYRCFEHLKLSDLRRFNVIVGRNASGKTALLEGLFMASGASPELVLRTKSWRGMTGFAISNQRTPYEELWRDLFSRFDQSKVVSISFKGRGALTRSMKISYPMQQQMVIPLPEPSSAFESAPVVPIVFEWEDSGGRKCTASPLLTAEGPAFKIEGELNVAPAAFFSSANPPPARELATNFSNFSIRNAEGALVEAIRSEFPFVKGLRSETRAAGSLVYAQIEDFPEKIPVNLLSTGINKLLSIVLGIATQAGGVVFIDEIENGFYYEKLSSHLRVLHNFCKQYDVQVFASSHSREFLEALAETFQSSPDDVTLIRSEMHGGQAKVEHFRGRNSLTAMKRGEVR